MKDVPIGVLSYLECGMNHDHETAWFCQEGFGGAMLRLENIQRDVLRLTQAIEGLSERLRQGAE